MKPLLLLSVFLLSSYSYSQEDKTVSITCILDGTRTESEITGEVFSKEAVKIQQTIIFNEENNTFVSDSYNFLTKDTFLGSSGNWSDASVSDRKFSSEVDNDQIHLFRSINNGVEVLSLDKLFNVKIVSWIWSSLTNRNTGLSTMEGNYIFKITQNGKGMGFISGYVASGACAKTEKQF